MDRVKVAIPLVLLSAVACALPSVFDWTVKAPLPVPRADHALVAVGGKLYALGGFSGSTLARVDAYDPATNGWAQVAPMASARREFAAAAVGGKIYVACGMDWSDPNHVAYVKSTEEYDPATNTWRQRAPCPVDAPFTEVYGNVHIGGAVAAGQFWLLAFVSGAEHAATLWAYDAASDRWTSKSSPPFLYARFSATELNGKLYVVASDTAPGTTRTQSSLGEYDPATDTWVIRSALPGVWWSALAASDGKLYTLGGSGGGSSGAFSEVNEYDPAGDHWASAGKLLLPRHSAAAASLDGHGLWITGGSTSATDLQATPTASVELGTPAQR